jgi:D-alanyl-D-alanine carboxypeptidase
MTLASLCTLLFALLPQAQNQSIFAVGQEPGTAFTGLAGADRLGAMQIWADQYVEKSGVPGVSLAVAWPDGKVLAVCSGFADLDRGLRLTLEHRLMSGSIGKTYFAALFMALAEQGLMQAGDPLSKYLGSESWYSRLPNHDQITLQSLLRHTSGVKEHVRDPMFFADAVANPTRVWQPQELLEYILDEEPLFEVDQGWFYADTNYILLGMAMEKAMQQSVYREVYRRFLGPQKLQDTLPNSTPDLAGLAQGYHILGEPGWTEPKPTLHVGKFYLNPQLEWCGGGYYSTSSDLARWGALLYSGKVVDSLWLEQSVKAAVAARLHPGDLYGWGVIISQTKLGRALGHSGWFPGYLAEMMYFPEHGFCVAVQVNTDQVRQSGDLHAHAIDVASLLVDQVLRAETKD